MIVEGSTFSGWGRALARMSLRLLFVKTRSRFWIVFPSYLPGKMASPVYVVFYPKDNKFCAIGRNKFVSLKGDPQIGKTYGTKWSTSNPKCPATVVYIYKSSKKFWVIRNKFHCPCTLFSEKTVTEVNHLMDEDQKIKQKFLLLGQKFNVSGGILF